jgi:hypothetical protein
MRRDIALFLGLVALIGGGIVAAIIFFVGDSGGGNNLCDQPLPPMGESEISQPAFQAEDAGLTTVIEAASAGDLPAAQNAFSGDVRNFTYDVDQPLREVDEELAKELCQAVNSIEEELTVNQRADRVAIQATRIRDLVRQAAEALGYARPG